MRCGGFFVKLKELSAPDVRHWWIFLIKPSPAAPYCPASRRLPAHKRKKIPQRAHGNSRSFDGFLFALFCLALCYLFYKTSHQPFLLILYAPRSHCQHDRQRQTYIQCHARFASHQPFFKTKCYIKTAVYPFHGRPLIVVPLPSLAFPLHLRKYPRVCR